METASTSTSPFSARSFNASVSARSWGTVNTWVSSFPRRSGQNMKRSSLSGEKAKRRFGIEGTVVKTGPTSTQRSRPLCRQPSRSRRRWALTSPLVRFARLRGPDDVTRFARVVGSMVYRLDTPPWAEGPTSLGPATAHPYREEDLLCPVTPSKIVCVGRNYLAHAKELGNDAPTEPLLFLKPPSSLVGPNDRVVLPKASTRAE